MVTTTRKYTLEQIQAELARPKSKGGRPKKYATDEERKAARAEYARRARRRKRANEAGIAIADDDYIAPKQRSHATTEERQLAGHESDQRYIAAHLEEHRLKAAAYWFSKHH